MNDDQNGGVRRWRYPQDGWYISWKMPAMNKWFGGTRLVGNPNLLNSPSHHHFYKCYKNHSQSWVVYGIVLITLAVKTDVEFIRNGVVYRILPWTAVILPLKYRNTDEFTRDVAMNHGDFTWYYCTVKHIHTTGFTEDVAINTGDHTIMMYPILTYLMITQNWLVAWQISKIHLLDAIACSVAGEHVQQQHRSFSYIPSLYP